MYRSRKTFRVALPALLSLGALVGSTGVQAQECKVTPEGRICHIPQEIRAGIEVNPDTQRLLGLITINGGCSGTLLNRFWVLTARHCVTQPPPAPFCITPPPPPSTRCINEPISNPLMRANQVSVTAAWAPGLVGLAERIYDFAGNVNGFSSNVNTTNIMDIVLVYLGVADLGAVDSQRIYAVERETHLSGRLTTKTPSPNTGGVFQHSLQACSAPLQPYKVVV